jgi:regulator of cell morphogenesis and NO signaling
MTATLDRTIRDIVAADYRTAAIFQRYGLDFCCRGNRTVEAACQDAGIAADRVQRDLADATALPPSGCAPRFDTWDLPALTGHIVANHHAYVRTQLPVIQGHAHKVARVHGSRHPEMVEVAEIFDRVSEEMTAHMAKEEQVLFPYLDRLAEASIRGEGSPPAPFGTVGNPIRMMEAEHESAGDAMAEIRALTGGYRIPDDACGTFSVLLQELEAFERDLHQHVHLENNILFPKSLQLEAGDRR